MKTVISLTAGWRTLWLVLVSVLFLAFGVGSAHAHARLLRSAPADKSESKKAPEQVELWFGELLDTGFNTIEVFSAAEVDSKSRTNLLKGAVIVDEKDRTHLSVAVQPLKTGDYMIEYRVLSRDGHTASGRLTFRVVEAKE